MVNWLRQLLERTESPSQVTVTAPPQLSLVVTPFVFGGTWLAHVAVKLLGQIMLGGVVSRTVIICAHEALFPHRSVAR